MTRPFLQPPISDPRLSSPGRRVSIPRLLVLVFAAAMVVAGCENKRGPRGPSLPPPVERTEIRRAGERADRSRPRSTHADSAAPQRALNLRPLGTLPFDGVVLPLVALRGEGEGAEILFATEFDATPGLPALLADGTPESRAVPPALRIAAFRAGVGTIPRPRDGGISAIAWTESLPRGVLLGRSCDARGFLVEWPRWDGSRWIGHVDWDSGAVNWLVRDAAEAAFASLGPRGELAFSRRSRVKDPATAGEFELVVRSGASGGGVEGPGAGEERVISRPDMSLVYPIFASGGEVLHAIALPKGPGARMRVVAVRLAAGEGAPSVLAEVELGVDASMPGAFQAAICVQSPCAGPASGPLSRGVALMSALSSSMIWIDPDVRSSLALAPGTVGMVPILDHDSRATGFLLGSPTGLLYQQIAAESPSPTFAQASIVRNGSFVPRSAGAGKQAKCILFSPPASDEVEQLGVYEVGD